MDRAGPGRARKGKVGSGRARWGRVGQASATPQRAIGPKPDLVGPFERQHLARPVRCGPSGVASSKAHSFDDLTGFGTLLGIGFRQLTGTDPKRVLQPDADVAAHRRSRGRNRQLVLARAQDRSLVLIGEQAIGGAFHVHHIPGMCPDPAHHREHC